MAAPGTPKTTSVPSLSITRTTASITFILGIAGLLRFCRQAVAPLTAGAPMVCWARSSIRVSSAEWS